MVIFNALLQKMQDLIEKDSDDMLVTNWAVGGCVAGRNGVLELGSSAKTVVQHRISAVKVILEGSVWGGVHC